MFECKTVCARSTVARWSDRGGTQGTAEGIVLSGAGEGVCEGVYVGTPF